MNLSIPQTARPQRLRPDKGPKTLSRSDPNEAGQRVQRGGGKGGIPTSAAESALVGCPLSVPLPVINCTFMGFEEGQHTKEQEVDETPPGAAERPGETAARQDGESESFPKKPTVFPA